MTCVISLVTPAFAVVVGDRRVSLLRNRLVDRVHSHLANKSIVFRATDGILSIGYTGVAYMGRQTTDAWIAKVLWGSATWGGGLASTKSVSDAVHRLRKAMDHHAGARGGLTLLLAGFRSSDRGWTPVNLELIRAEKASQTRVHGHLRMARPLQIFRAIGSPPTLAERTVAQARYLPLGGGVDAERIVDLLAALVRTVAARDRGVGVDLMATIVRPPGHGDTLCRFMPFAGSAPAVSVRVGAMREVEATHHSPWILTQVYASPPASVHAGSGYWYETPGCNIVVEALQPATPGEEVFFSWSLADSAPPP